MQEPIGKTQRSVRFTDVVALAALAYCVYLGLNGKLFACAVAFTAAAYSWLSGRKVRGGGPGRQLARLVDRYALNVGIVLLIVAALSDFSSHFSRVDFGMFYSNALLLRRSPDRLYDVYLQADVLREVSGIKENHYLTFVYPPFVAFLFVPLTFFSFKTAYYLMLVSNLAFLCLSVYCLIKLLPLERSQVRALILCFAATLPVYVTLVLGHVSFWGLLLLSMFCADLLGGRNVRAGLWSGLLSYKISLLPIPLVVLMFLGLWRGLALALGVMAVLGGISIGLVGFDAYVTSLRILYGMSNETLLPRMHSLRSLTYFLGLGEWAWVVLSVLVIALLWLAFARNGDRKWTLAAMVLCILLVTPYLHTHDLVLGIVALALVISRNHRMSSAEEKLYVIAAFLPVAVSIWLQSGGRRWPVMPVVLLVFFAYCVFRALSRRGTGIDAEDYAVA